MKVGKTSGESICCEFFRIKKVILIGESRKGMGDGELSWLSSCMLLILSKINPLLITENISIHSKKKKKSAGSLCEE